MKVAGAKLISMVIRTEAKWCKSHKCHKMYLLKKEDQKITKFCHAFIYQLIEGSQLIPKCTGLKKKKKAALWWRCWCSLDNKHKLYCTVSLEFETQFRVCRELNPM